MDMTAGRVWWIRLGHVGRCRTHPKQLSGKAEFHLLLDSGKYRYLDRSETTECLKHVVDQFLGRGGARGNPDRIGIQDPCRVQLASVGDQVARYSLFCAYLAQAVRIGAILGTDEDRKS